jgi:hypothetical protein
MKRNLLAAMTAFALFSFGSRYARANAGLHARRVKILRP